MRILPGVSDLTAPYWRAARQHRLDLQRCGGCGRLQHPPGPSCERCHSSELEWSTMSGRGEVYSFTVVHHSVHPVTAGHLPYVVALVELEEGPRLVANIGRCPIDQVRIGLPVTVCFDDLGEEITLPQFEPATQAG